MGYRFLGGCGVSNRGAPTPGDVTAEHAVIAALLATPASFDEVTEHLAAEDFLDPACAAVYRAVLAVDAAGRPIDQITIADEMRRAKSLARIGGVERLAELATAGGEIANLAAHVDIIAEKARLRRVIDAGRAMVGAATAPDAVGTAVTDYAETLVFDLTRDKGRSSLTPLSRAVPPVLAEIAAGRDQVVLGHSTGLEDLDALTGGLQPGQLWIVAARPGVGKSALALQMARHVAESTGAQVPFLSYEMSVPELALRLLASSLGFGMRDLRTGNIPEGMDRDIVRAGEHLASIPLLIDDNPPSTISGVRAQMRRLARRNSVGAIFVDYLQLMESGRRRDANRNDEVSDITRGLKKLAAELQVPIVALSQLNRNVELRGGAKRPQLSDLRDSGAVEQDANVVLFVYRESTVNPHGDPTMSELIVGKQRSGPTGVVYTEFDSECTRFRTTTRRPMGGSGGGMARGSNPF
jgi:replicative DNA helicase